MKTKTPSKPKASPGGPAVGVLAPSFTLTSDAGDSVSLKDYRGKWVVLYFYPKDHTPAAPARPSPSRARQVL